MGQMIGNIIPVELFTQPFMAHALMSGTIVAILVGLVGFFVVLRGSAFVAHVLPKVGFSGAAGSLLIGANSFLGLVIFSIGGALSIGWLGKRGRHDVVTALILIVALGTGALFLGLDNNYSTDAFAILFGQIVGVSTNQVMETAVLGVVCVGILGFLYRPLLFASIMKDSAAARGIRLRGLEMAFLVVVGLATAVTVPVVGALLCFSLLIGPAATARCLGKRPVKVLTYSVLISVMTVWGALILGYDTGWPIGFFVSAISAGLYGLARGLNRVYERRARRDLV
ncbi:metal ABC transporter permease [Alicyclobacillus dauci]|uniref:Metal ABC transporter permease n=1 Tax=Alicyclobacillus dauci TaxID=1475485 RepID=A0ABY6YZP5_9BACL|nr:metal ABC transporter permease [Alicyclobacillus dauci]WAH35788.1 metal ABC transporter permease [Alicyclobacillus dauci]